MPQVALATGRVEELARVTGLAAVVRTASVAETFREVVEETAMPSAAVRGVHADMTVRAHERVAVAVPAAWGREGAVPAEEAAVGDDRRCRQGNPWSFRDERNS